MRTYEMFCWYTTGGADVNDGKLQITIHYEVVDLGQYGWSPLSFIDANESVYVRSERYVILQTYVFKNIHATEDINNLEFYQMMHGHPANADSDLADLVLFTGELTCNAKGVEVQ